MTKIFVTDCADLLDIWQHVKYIRLCGELKFCVYNLIVGRNAIRFNILKTGVVHVRHIRVSRLTPLVLVQEGPDPSYTIEECSFTSEAAWLRE